MALETKKSTILYVEDNPDNRSLIRRVLEAEGYAVVEAINATQALEKLESSSIDLVLMDINMPEMDGYTLTARIKINRKVLENPHCCGYSECNARRSRKITGGRM